MATEPQSVAPEAALLGSDKQVAWASTIRAEALATLNGRLADVAGLHPTFGRAVAEQFAEIDAIAEPDVAADWRELLAGARAVLARQTSAAAWITRRDATISLGALLGVAACLDPAALGVTLTRLAAAARRDRMARRLRVVVQDAFEHYCGQPGIPAAVRDARNLAYRQLIGRA